MGPERRLLRAKLRSLSVRQLAGIVLGVVAAVSGCSTPSARPSTTATFPSSPGAQSTTAAPEPGEPEGSFSDLLNVDLVTANRLWNKTTNEYIGRCLEAAGYNRPASFGSDQTYFESDAGSNQAALTLDPAQRQLNQLLGIQQPEIPGDPTDGLQDPPLGLDRSPGAPERYIMCTDRAVELIPDPSEAVWGIFEELPNDLDAQVSADERVKASKASEGACLHELGLADASVNDLQNRLSDTTATIMQNLEGAKITKDQAIAELERQAEYERKIGPGALRCHQPRYELESSVYSEIERRWYDDHPTVLADARTTAHESNQTLVEIDVDQLPLPEG